MATDVIVLNGGSSSGKSSLARCLQDVLPEPWLTFSVDDLIRAMPASMQESDAGIEFAADGGITVGPEFRIMDEAWARGIAAMAGAGARVIVDDVFLGGPSSQDRWLTALAGLEVHWVGVRCDPAVAAAREAGRGDRIGGMAASQAMVVHEGVTYDVEVDTTRTDVEACASVVAGHVVQSQRSG